MVSILKSLAAGLRIGWLVGPQTVIERLGDIKMQLNYDASSLSQCVVAELLNSELYEKHLTKLRNNLNNTVIKVINVICGIILIYYGLKLGYSFLQIML